MSFRVQVPRMIYDAMIAHAQADVPYECVGLLAGRDIGGMTPPARLVVERYPLVNALASPTRFESDARSMFEAEKKRRAAGLEFVAVYHSHPSSPAVPSKRDLQMNYSEDVMNIILSLMGPVVDVKAYWLTADSFREGSLVIVP